MKKKTQITDLRSGLKKQMLNPKIDYSELPKNTSSNMHSGSNHLVVADIWQKIVEENPECLTIKLLGKKITLKIHRSYSGKTVYYISEIPPLFTIINFPIRLAKGINPTIIISGANIIEIRNGKRDYVYICPSFIRIL